MYRLLIILLCVSPVWSQAALQFHRPIPEAQLTQKLNPGFHHPDPLPYSSEQRAQIAAALQAGSLQTLTLLARIVRNIREGLQLHDSRWQSTKRRNDDHQDSHRALAYYGLRLFRGWQQPARV